MHIHRQQSAPLWFTDATYALHTGSNQRKRQRSYAMPSGNRTIAENAHGTPCENPGAFCWHSQPVDNKTLRNNALPTYQQVINTLLTCFSTPNTGKRSLVCGATKHVLPAKQGFPAPQQRLVCTRRHEKSASMGVPEDGKRVGGGGCRHWIASWRGKSFLLFPMFCGCTPCFCARLRSCRAAFAYGSTGYAQHLLITC